MACFAALTALAADATRTDRKNTSFIKEAAEGGLAEVHMGKMAAERGSNEHIKQLGQRLVQDHTKANDELSQIAQKAGVTIPTSLEHKEMRMENKLEGKSGADFDKAFAEYALVDHQKDITKFQSALQNVKDPELRAFIEKNLPVLRQHLQMARTAASAVGVDAKTLATADRFLSNQTGVGSEGLGSSGSSQTGVGSQRNTSSDTSTGSSSTTTSPNRDANK